MKQLLLALVLLSPTLAYSDPLSVSMTCPTQTLRPGVAAPVTVTLANTLTPRPDIVVSCAVTWTDSYGTEHMAFGDPLTLVVVQPVTVRTFALVIPSGCEYVAGSGLVDGAAVEPVPLSGQWVWSLQRELLEQQQLVLAYSVRAL
jgi:hypothetical protein